MSDVAVAAMQTVESLSYGDAIDLLESAQDEKHIGGLIVFAAKTACGKPTIVVINQHDSGECVQITL